MIAKIRNAVCAALFALLAGPAAASAQDYQQDYPDSYGDSDIRQTVARLSYIYGNVAFSRGDEPDDWQPADRNVPMTLGDRVWTANGRLELQIHGGNVVRLAKSTALTALNLTEDTSQFSLSAGIATFKIRRLDDYEVFEVDTPNAAVTFETPGEYRIDVRGDGYTRIQVRRGQATVASGGGQVPLGAGDAILLEGYETPRYDFVSIKLDSWDRWVSSRDAQYTRVRSYEYVSPSIAGVEDLDGYGQWQSLPSYGWSWTPSAVAVGWAPYRAGRWMWQDPWGWTWVSTERWGWAPYHYGRWVKVQSRWYWVPGSRSVIVPYRPALVAFVGGGPGFSVSVGVGTDYIGWFPLAPREPFIPWWGRPAVNVNINVTNITYVNRTYVTVVNQTTFVGGQVATNYVRDRAIINRVERAPVLAGPIPVYPTRASLRTSTRATTAPRPPAAVISRPVVARLAPPPAPPRFEQKEAVIRQNRGAPVNPAEAHRLAGQRDQLRPPVPVRPVVREPGRVELAPRNQTAKTVQPQPVTAPRGRELATRERPVAPEPAPQPERRRQAPATAPASAPTPDRDPRDRPVQPPVSRERVTPQESESQQRQQQQQRETVQRETQQREAEQQKQREADQREAQQRQLQQQQQQRETAQRETQQREAEQQKQREADQREAQQRRLQQQQQQQEQQQQETAQRETQQREAARQRVTAPSSESAPRRGPAPTAVPSERVQPPAQAKERAQPAERVSPQPRAQRPQNPPDEPEARSTPSRQRGRVTPTPTPADRKRG